MIDELQERIQEIASKEKEKQTAKLDIWNYDGVQLFGLVYDHPRLPDGTPIHTSLVMWIDTAIKMAETRNTVYILLEPA